jgi:hypothetical protein
LCAKARQNRPVKAVYQDFGLFVTGGLMRKDGSITGQFLKTQFFLPGIGGLITRQVADIPGLKIETWEIGTNPAL